MTEMTTQDIDVVDVLTRPGTYVLALAIYLVMLGIRRLVETQWPSLKKAADANSPKATYLTRASRWWNEVVLYFLPVGLGLASGCIRSEFLFGPIGDRGGKLVFGAVVGWLCSFLYKCLRKAVKQRLGVDIVPDASADNESEGA